MPGSDTRDAQHISCLGRIGEFVRLLEQLALNNRTAYHGPACLEIVQLLRVYYTTSYESLYG